MVSKDYMDYWVLWVFGRVDVVFELLVSKFDCHWIYIKRFVDVWSSNILDLIQAPDFLDNMSNYNFSEAVRLSATFTEEKIDHFFVLSVHSGNTIDDYLTISQLEIHQVLILNDIYISIILFCFHQIFLLIHFFKSFFFLLCKVWATRFIWFIF